MIINIYCIVNKLTNKKYIGKTSKKHIIDRFNDHCYSAKYGSQTYLHKAIRKYGKNSFQIQLIEICDNEISSKRETFLIKENNTLIPNGYNMTEGGDGGDTSSSPNSQNWIYKLRNEGLMNGANNSMFGKKGENNPNFGQIRGKKPKISQGQKENWKNNIERKEKARLRVLGNKYGYNNKKQAKPIIIEGIKYNSIGQASATLKISVSKIKKIGKFINE